MVPLITTVKSGHWYLASYVMQHNFEICFNYVSSCFKPSVSWMGHFEENYKDKCQIHHVSVQLNIHETNTSIFVHYLECDFTIMNLLYNYNTYFFWWNIHFVKSTPPHKIAILKKLQCKTYIVAAPDFILSVLLTTLLQCDFISGLLFNVRSSLTPIFWYYKFSFLKSPSCKLSCQNNLCPTLLDWNIIQLVFS